MSTQLKSKKQIVDSLISTDVEECEIPFIEQAMDKWATQQSTAFAEWIPFSGWHIVDKERKGLWMQGNNWPTTLITTTELYQLFLQDKNK